MSGYLPGFYAGWLLVLAAFLSGAGLGLFFHRDDFLGGYASFPRRIVRLGHIALAALGLMNVVLAISIPAQPSALLKAGSFCLILGGITMPAVCFLSGWKAGLRLLFPIPVVALISAVILVLVGATI
jgi:hypothetical protein